MAFGLIAATANTGLTVLELGALVLVAVIIYMVYKFAWPRDFGLPVRRKLFRVRMKVERNQVAYVPFYWTDIQVQRAIKTHWKQAMRDSFAAPTNIGPSPKRAKPKK